MSEPRVDWVREKSAMLARHRIEQEEMEVREAREKLRLSQPALGPAAALVSGVSGGRAGDMTLAEWYAGHALAGLVAHGGVTADATMFPQRAAHLGRELARLMAALGGPNG